MSVCARVCVRTPHVRVYLRVLRVRVCVCVHSIHMHVGGEQVSPVRRALRERGCIINFYGNITQKHIVVSGIVVKVAH